MAAVFYPMADPWVTDRPDRPDVALYRRRRAVALLMLVVAVLAAVTVSRLALAGPGGGALTTPGSSGAPSASLPAPGGHLYVVQPGDTLWSIVGATSHARDLRPEVDRLALQLNSRRLQPGQRLRLR